MSILSKYQKVGYILKLLIHIQNGLFPKIRVLLSLECMYSEVILSGSVTQKRSLCNIPDFEMTS